MPAFTTQIKLLIRFLAGCEAYAALDQFSYQCGAFADNGPNHVFFTQAGAGGKGVVHVKVKRIVVRHHCGNATLRVVCVALGALFLGNDSDGAEARHLQGEGQTRHAAADDQKVKVLLAHGLLANRDHSFDRARCANSDVFRDFDLILQLLQRGERVLKRDLVHMRATDAA